MITRYVSCKWSQQACQLCQKLGEHPDQGQMTRQDRLKGIKTGTKHSVLAMKTKQKQTKPKKKKPLEMRFSFFFFLKPAECPDDGISA